MPDRKTHTRSFEMASSVSLDGSLEVDKICISILLISKVKFAKANYAMEVKTAYDK